MTYEQAVELLHWLRLIYDMMCIGVLLMGIMLIVASAKK